MKSTEVAIISFGSFFKIQIVNVEYGFSKILKDGKWVNMTELPQREETELLTIEKCFIGFDVAEKYTKTNKAFKSILKILQNKDLF